MSYNHFSNNEIMSVTIITIGFLTLYFSTHKIFPNSFMIGYYAGACLRDMMGLQITLLNHLTLYLFGFMVMREYALSLHDFFANGNVK